MSASASCMQQFLDVARSSVWTKTSKKDRMFYVRMNNSTRELPDADLAEYVADHWTALTALQ